MRKVVLLCIVSLVATLPWITPVHGYSRVLVVEVYASSSIKVNEEVNVMAYIHSGNNLKESVTDVQAVLIVPENAYLTSGVNPAFIGRMGPGPADAYCSWIVAFTQPSAYTVSVNVSCIDTQGIARWLINSTMVEVYDFPHAEFTYERVNPFANETVLFDATSSHANAPSGWIVSYEWDFGDGEIVTLYNSVVEHVFQAVGNHEVSLNVTDSRGLSNISTNSIVVSLFGDINLDNTVNILDVSIVAHSYGSHEGDEKWDARSDLNHDLVIDILDVARVAVEYGTTA